MRSRTIISAVLVTTAAALAASTAGGAATKDTKITNVTSQLELFTQGVPNPNGIHFGFVKSSRPLGKGVHHSAFTVKPTGMGKGSVTGRFRNYYRLGTTTGTVALTFSATSPKDFTYKGTVTLTGGTGKFRKVQGSGPIECTSSDGGAHKACTVNVTLTAP